MTHVESVIYSSPDRKVKITFTELDQIPVVEKWSLDEGQTKDKLTFIRDSPTMNFNYCNVDNSKKKSSFKSKIDSKFANRVNACSKVTLFPDFQNSRFFHPGFKQKDLLPKAKNKLSVGYRLPAINLSNTINSIGRNTDNLTKLRRDWSKNTNQIARSKRNKSRDFNYSSSKEQELDCRKSLCKEKIAQESAKQQNQNEICSTNRIKYSNLWETSLKKIQEQQKEKREQMSRDFWKMYNDLMGEHGFKRSVENAERFKHLSRQLDRATTEEWHELKQERTDEISIVMTTFTTKTGVRVVANQDPDLDEPKINCDESRPKPVPV